MTTKGTRGVLRTVTSPRQDQAAPTEPRGRRPWPAHSLADFGCVLVLAGCLSGCMTTAPEGPGVSPDEPSPAEPREAAKRQAATAVAGRLGDDGFLAFLDEVVPRDRSSVELVALLEEHALRTGDESVAAEAEALRALEAALGEGGGAERAESLSLRRATRSGEALDSATTLVAYTPAGDDAAWTDVEAFDAASEALTLDAWATPDRQVLVVDLEPAASLVEDLALVNVRLREAGLQAEPPALPPPDGREDFWYVPPIAIVSSLRSFFMDSDEEPFLAGSAEVYAIVSGVNAAGTGPEVQVIDVPHADDEDQWYYQSQALVYWNAFAGSRVSVQYMERDGSDLSGLADLIVAGVGVVSPTVGAIGGAILAILPSSWLRNDDDFLDQLYVDRGLHSCAYNGRNVDMNLCDVDSFTGLVAGCCSTHRTCGCGEVCRAPLPDGGCASCERIGCRCNERCCEPEPDGSCRMCVPLRASCP